jgi:hypothetical protein
MYFLSGRPYKGKLIFRLSLSDLEPLSTRVARAQEEGFYAPGSTISPSLDIVAVQLFTSNNARKIFRIEVPEVPLKEVARDVRTSEGTERTIEIPFVSRAATEEAAQLFKELIKACGGKAEPF